MAARGGQHYTWDHFHVLGPAPPQSNETEPAAEGGSDIVPALLGAGAAALVVSTDQVGSLSEASDRGLVAES